MIKHEHEKWNKKNSELTENKKGHTCECDHEVENDYEYTEEENDCHCGC